MELSPAFEPNALIDLYHARIAKSRSVGKDGVRHSIFSAKLNEECKLISAKVKDETYCFSTYREKLIVRGATRLPRQISIPTIRDRLVLRAVCNALKELFPLANTPPPHALIKDCKTAMRSARAHSSFLRMDIKDFYPSLRHETLRLVFVASDIPTWLISLIMKAISTPTGSAKGRSILGVPQGLSISNALAAIYMGGFDASMEGEHFYRRYVDDVLVIARTERISSIYKSANISLSEYGLTSHSLGTIGKTEEVRLDDGVQYLGYLLNPKLVSVRKASLTKMFSNLYRVFTEIKYAKVLSKKDLFRLNLKITGCLVNGTRRGWLMFFSQSEDLVQLKRLDRFVTAGLQNTAVDTSSFSIKRFVKSFYEIRFNLSLTKYIPNFDTYEQGDRIELVSLLSGLSIAEVSSRSSEFIDQEFSRLVSREVSELEKDVTESFS